MLTSEEVREIEAVMDDPVKRWAMSPGAAITYIEALLEDRAELVAENERLRTVVEWQCRTKCAGYSSECTDRCRAAQVFRARELSR